MSSSITTLDALKPGCVVVLDRGSGSEEWLRVVSTAGRGPFTSEVRPVGRWERLWLMLGASARRVWWLWRRRVWWPVCDWVEDQVDAWRQR